jgi:hypothetical protein
MKVNDFFNEVARRADTAGTQINVAETRRVLAVAFDLMAELDGDELMEFLARALAQARKRAAKKETP